MREQEYPTSQQKYLFISRVVDKAKAKDRDFFFTILKSLEIFLLDQ